MKKWLNKYKFHVLVWVICVSFLVWALAPLLTSKMIAGWDTTAHYYLFTKMVDFLKAGHITGYDTGWLGGFPAFSFYGPMPYILMAIPHFASAGLINMAASFNLFLFLLPFAFLVSLYYISRVYFGDKVSVWSLVFGVLFLGSIKTYAYMGFGIHAIVYVGLFSSFLSMVLMLFFFGFLQRLLVTNRPIYLFLGALVLAMIIMTHAMSTIFAGIVFAIFTLCNFKKFWKNALLLFCMSLVFSSFWLVPFLKNLAFSSGDELGIGGMSVSDPLLAMFPLPGGSIFSSFAGVLILVCSIFGVIGLIREKRYFWPASYLTTLLFLPRDFFGTLLNQPIHYYRFTANVAVLGIIVSAFGLNFLLEKCAGARLAPRVSKTKKIMKGFVVAFVAVTMFATMANHLNLTNEPGNYKHEYRPEKYFDGAFVKEIMDYIKTLHVKGRIAAYTYQISQDNLGSPHFLTALIPLETGVPVVPGLLAESALSTQYLIPVLNKLGLSYNWGKTVLLGDAKFNDKDYASMIDRLGLYNVEYIVTSKVNADDLVARVKSRIKRVKDIQNYSVLKLAKFKPLIESTNYKPFLYVDNGGMSFFDFSKEWFKSDKLLDYPIIYTKKGIASLPEDEKQQIGGYIFSYPQTRKIDGAEYKEWLGLGKNIIFLNAELSLGKTEKREQNDHLIFITKFGVNVGIEELETALIGFNQESIFYSEVVPTVKQDMKLAFNSEGGTLINYSYFPKWAAVRADQNVYWSTPSMMWIFGKGGNEMRYE